MPFTAMIPQQTIDARVDAVVRCVTEQAPRSALSAVSAGIVAPNVWALPEFASITSAKGIQYAVQRSLAIAVERGLLVATQQTAPGYSHPFWVYAPAVRKASP